MKHGDAVKDIGFQVEDLDAIFKVSFSFSFLPFSQFLLLFCMGGSGDDLVYLLMVWCLF